MKREQTEQEIQKLIDDAVAAERNRCVQICMEQYIYWRDAEESRSDEHLAFSYMVLGSIGASSNILARIEGLISPMVFVERAPEPQKGGRGE